MSLARSYEGFGHMTGSATCTLESEGEILVKVVVCF